MKLLSIIIPTYNRKDSLLRQLKEIEKQGRIDEYDLIISDNNSNYDIGEHLKNNLSEDFFANIYLHSNKCNIGALGNISQILLLSKTTWFWTLSDDDIVAPDSLNIVLNDIKNNTDDISMIKYTYIDNIDEKHREIIESIDQLIKHYTTKKNSVGHLLFLSINVYNLEKVKPYADKIYTYSYTGIPHIIPFFWGLFEKKIKILFSEKKVVTYMYPDLDDHWNIIDIMLGLSTISDFLIFNKKQLNNIRKLFANNFQSIRFYKSCLSIKDRSLRIMVYRKCFFSLYYYKHDIKDWLYFLLFLIQHYLRIDCIKIGQRMKSFIK